MVPLHSYHQTGPFDAFVPDARQFFFIKASWKKIPVLKTAWQGLSEEVYTNWKKTWGHDLKA